MGSGDVPVLNLDRLRELMFASAGGTAASPFDTHPYLVVQAVSGDQADADKLAAWLRTQPCPVIGIAGEGSDPAVLTACDLVLDSFAELDAIAANIRRAPLAAMTLVQVLRVTAGMPLAQALVVESLAYSTLQGGPEFAAWSRANPPAPHGVAAEDGPPVLIARAGEHLDIRLNRPRNRNPMSVEMRDALVEALQLVVADETIRGARVSGVGACFSSGGELREFGTAPDPASAHAVRSLRLPAAVLIRCADRVAFHLHSACIGAGIELPAFAVRITAARNAFLQLPEIRFGLIPGAGGCVSLPQRIGRQRTAYLALSARRINAATALEWGLVDEIVD
ncbi:enoyl-CoA hydratase/isomerase family protein [Aromatoleum anaerobium]|uniref:Enoyl-CoA hydratase/isomerase family protein n=1 Tax=Aromatoleum anaerobium TaxID=182180 RepID=A0ABX1PKS0_9RHOO|nr:enoyl-CoA hydratase/isomerase family protein [Aromatoleum anaerobium]MCK0508174.1 enoyl-CoA hydratase/isomerase family protein [Aromatoleum anaerobium]